MLLTNILNYQDNKLPIRVRAAGPLNSMFIKSTYSLTKLKECLALTEKMQGQCILEHTCPSPKPCHVLPSPRRCRGGAFLNTRALHRNLVMSCTQREDVEAADLRTHVHPPKHCHALLSQRKCRSGTLAHSKGNTCTSPKQCHVLHSPRRCSSG